MKSITMFFLKELNKSPNLKKIVDMYLDATPGQRGCIKICAALLSFYLVWILTLSPALEQRASIIKSSEDYRNLIFLLKSNDELLSSSAGTSRQHTSIELQDYLFKKTSELGLQVSSVSLIGTNALKATFNEIPYDSAFRIIHSLETNGVRVSNAQIAAVSNGTVDLLLNLE